jgi:short-subunit dehydrogenase
MSGVSPMPNFAIYSATKCCLTNFFKALRVELKGKVKITTVMPGGVYTRPDVVNDIKGQGLWGKLSAKNPDFIVKKSLKAVKRNKKVEIPGFWNKFLYFILKITPENLTLKIIRNRWSKQQKDAF